MAAVPIYKSRYGPVDLAFQGNHNMMPIGLGPCSQATEIYGRHQEGNKCWGTFPSQWYLQGDSSMQCTDAYNLSQFTGYFTSPQSNLVATQDVPDTPIGMATAQSSINSSLRNPTAGSINGRSCTCGGRTSGTRSGSSGAGYPATGYAVNPYM